MSSAAEPLWPDLFLTLPSLTDSLLAGYIRLNKEKL